MEDLLNMLRRDLLEGRCKVIREEERVNRLDVRYRRISPISLARGLKGVQLGELAWRERERTL